MRLIHLERYYTSQNPVNKAKHWSHQRSTLTTSKAQILTTSKEMLSLLTPITDFMDNTLTKVVALVLVVSFSALIWPHPSWSCPPHSSPALPRIHHWGNWGVTLHECKLINRHRTLQESTRNRVEVHMHTHAASLAHAQVWLSMLLFCMQTFRYVFFIIWITTWIVCHSAR